jgi:YHS domain-containing protein
MIELDKVPRYSCSRLVISAFAIPRAVCKVKCSVVMNCRICCWRSAPALDASMPTSVKPAGRPLPCPVSLANLLPAHHAGCGGPATLVARPAARDVVSFHWAGSGMLPSATRGRKGEVMATVTDPVCGMELDSAAAAASEEYQGKTYYFCSEGCHQRFVAAPEQYAV